MTRDRLGFVVSTVFRLCLGVLWVPWSVEAADVERPICTIAAISNPYITTLSAEELGKRSWLAASSPIGLRNAVAAVKSSKPDAFVVLGSLTWTGSDSDLGKLKTLLADVDVPLHLVPGPKDLANGGLERFHKHFPKQPGERSSERTRSAKHVFVLGHYPVLAAFGNNVKGPEATEILTLLRQYKVAAYLSGHRHRYDYRVHDGVAHVLCDCLCWGEYRSYQVYHVFPDRIVACWKPIFRADGNRPLYERVVFPEPRYRD